MGGASENPTESNPYHALVEMITGAEADGQEDLVKQRAWELAHISEWVARQDS